MKTYGHGNIPWSGGARVTLNGTLVTSVICVEMMDENVSPCEIVGRGTVTIFENNQYVTSEVGDIRITPIEDSVVNQMETEILNGINTATRICHQRAHQAGWWDDYDTAPEHLKPALLAGRQMLIVSEVAEAMEGLRKGRMDDHLPNRKAEEVELADAVIRIFDYAGKRGFNLGGAILDKMGYNLARADHKPENRAKEGGKCF